MIPRLTSSRVLLGIPALALSGPRLSSQLPRFYSSPPTPNKPTTGPAPAGQGERLRFWPFVFLFLLSSGSYTLIVRQRNNNSGTVSPENRRKAHNER